MPAFIELIATEKVATLILNRPEKRNAMHGPLIQELLTAIRQLAKKNALRMLILKGNGAHFCAGGDIAWMQQQALTGEDKNNKDAQLLADLLFELHAFPVPTIVFATGSVLGGGMGLVSACDMAFATEETNFGLPEVKIGLTPSIISPYVIAAIGQRAANYYFLTGEKFNAQEAYRLGLIHRIISREMLFTKEDEFVKQLLQNGPGALRAAKQLIKSVVKQDISENLAQQTAEHLANLRATPEAQEGLNAFLTHRAPQW